jgi:15-cis-phytoene synthase
LMMSCVLGLQHSDAKRQAAQMGVAMRLTSILRSVNIDQSCGRIYLPQDEMRRFGYTESDLDERVVNDAFRELMKFQIARARTMFQQAADGICWLAGDGSRLTASTMAVMHAGMLDFIESQQYDVFSRFVGRRSTLPVVLKLARIPRVWRLARRLSTEPMPRVF